MLKRIKPVLGWALSLAMLGGAGIEGQKNKGEQNGKLVFKTVLKDLNNPSSVSFIQPIPHIQMRLVCDGGNGRVLVDMMGGQQKQKQMKGFSTEYWKVDPKTGIKRFKVGPLSAVFAGEMLVVADSGKKDGQEALLFYRGPDAQVKKSNTVAGEGNLTGMAVSKDGQTIYVCGQGSDKKTWVLSCDVASRKLVTRFSADDHGIKTNSPMQVVVQDEDHILVLYSGKGGVADGMIVQWHVKSDKPSQVWNLPGLVDPMGMALLPGEKNTLVVVDNNWALTKVNKGQLAKVKLDYLAIKAGLTPAQKAIRKKKAHDATVVILDNKTLRGPTSCAFDADGLLHITQLGENFDKGQGSLISVSGVK